MYSADIFNKYRCVDNEMNVLLVRLCLSVEFIIPRYVSLTSTAGPCKQLSPILQL